MRVDKFQRARVHVRNRFGEHRVSLRYAVLTKGCAMQFLVYITVLMVSISTVLLEVHWLTSPAPQPKPAVQTASTNAARPKIEGPNAELSPVYPKPETPRPVTTASSAGQSDTAPANSIAGGSHGAPAPPTSIPEPAASSTATNAAPSQQPTVDTTAKAEAKSEPIQKLPETTGVAIRMDDAKPASSTAVPVAAPNRADNPSPPQPSAVASGNRCDVQACASAYKSFRASDCSYQPFDGSRRFCEKPPVQRTARDQRDEPDRRTWSRDPQQRNVERAVRPRVDNDDELDDRAAGDDEDSDQMIVIRRQGPRW